jgi:hypothetical protein
MCMSYCQLFKETLNNVFGLEGCYWHCSCRWDKTMSLNCGHQRDFYSSPKWYMSMERNVGMILIREERNTRSKSCPSATSSTTNPTWTDPGANPGLRCG